VSAYSFASFAFIAFTGITASLFMNFVDV